MVNNGAASDRADSTSKTFAHNPLNTSDILRGLTGNPAAKRFWGLGRLEAERDRSPFAGRSTNVRFWG